MSNIIARYKSNEQDNNNYLEIKAVKNEDKAIRFKIDDKEVLLCERQIKDLIKRLLKRIRCIRGYSVDYIVIDESLKISKNL